MSALSVRSGRAVIYGAEELKQAAHKYGFIALAISVLIHLSVIGLYFLVPPFDDARVPFVPKPDGPIIIVNVPPSVPGVYTHPPKVGQAGTGSKNPYATPVPVVDDPNIVEKRIDFGPGTTEGTDPTGADAPVGQYPVSEMSPDDVAPSKGWIPVEREPVIVRSVVPTYPEIALRAGIEGKVWVKIWVDKQGKARQVDIVKSDYDIFNEAAIEAAKKFVFTPAYMNNGPVSVWVSIPFTFKLSGR